jgi:predicted DNA binding CopG/RHH family protein
MGMLTYEHMTKEPLVEKRLTIRLPEELHKAAKIRAAVTGKPVSEVLREALEEWVGEDPLAGYEPKKKESRKE